MKSVSLKAIEQIDRLLLQVLAIDSLDQLKL